MDRSRARFIYLKWSTCKRSGCPFNVTNSYNEAMQCLMCKQHSTKSRYYLPWWKVEEEQK